MIVDGFGGPGGASLGMRLLGLDPVGIEWDAPSCATRAAAGHRTIRADVAAFPLDQCRNVKGVWQSPPCPTFSAAGKGEGRDEMAELLAFTAEAFDGWHDPAAHHDWTDPRTPLVLEPLRWVDALHPEWVVLEQVPPVLPLWEAFAQVWRHRGYSTWAGILNAADYWVPQTRRRAILLASRTRQAHPPEATHARGPEPTLFGPALAPWVSMAEALGWHGEGTPARTLCGDRSPRWLYPDHDGTHGRIVRLPVLNPGATDTQPNRRRYGPDEPAPVVAFGNDAASWRWEAAAPAGLNTGRDWKPGGTRDDAQVIPVDQPSPALDGQGGKMHWSYTRPATTVAGDPRVWPPGHKVNGDDRARLGTTVADARYGDRAGTDAVRLTVTEALVLQGFPPDYPVQGTRTAQFGQVGNAVPPPLAAACVASLTGLEREVAA